MKDATIAAAMREQVDVTLMEHIEKRLPPSEVADHIYFLEKDIDALEVFIGGLVVYDATDTSGFAYIIRKCSRHGISGEELAVQLGVTRGTVSRWGQEKRGSPPLFSRRAVISAIIELSMRKLDGLKSELKDAVLAKQDCTDESQKVT